MFYNNEYRNCEIRFKVTESQRQFLKDIAKKENLTVTKFVLKCIDYYIKNNK